MQNQEKIIQSIAAIIEKNTLGVSAQHNQYAQEVASEILSAIASHLEVGAGWDDDSQYIDDFLKWREKYFDRKTQVKHFRSKHNGEFRDIKQLERQYERAYNCNSKKEK